MAHDPYKDMRVAHDECYTTSNEADKLVNHLLGNGIIRKETIVWCPFDNDFSNIYKSLKRLWGGELLQAILKLV